MAQAASKTCEICNRASGVHFCIQCDQQFCEDCKISHLRSKVCRNHTFVRGPNIQQKAKVECTDHKEDFLFFCEECDVLICKYPKLFDHSVVIHLSKNGIWLPLCIYITFLAWYKHFNKQ